jgi:hypothetical protein
MYCTNVYDGEASPPQSLRIRNRSSPPSLICCHTSYTHLRLQPTEQTCSTRTQRSQTTNRSSVDAPPMRQHARKCAQPRLTVKPGARRSGAVARPAGGVATRDSQPQPHHTTLLSNFKRPRALATSSDHPQTWPEYRAWAVRRTPSESGHSGAQIPLNHTKTILCCLKPLKTRAGISDSHKLCPQWGLVLPDRPCHVGRRPTLRVELQGPGVGTYRLGDSARSAGRSAPKIGRPVDYGGKFTPTK